LSDKNIWTWWRGDWHHGDTRILGASSHATWLGSAVFDGARLFEGVTPDLDKHSARVNASAEALGLKPTHTGDEIAALSMDGLKKFEPQTDVYIRPMYWAEDGDVGVIPPDPNSTDFALCLEEMPMTAPSGYTVTVTRFFMVRGGEVFTPAPNGTFLDGITRQRVIGLLRGAGVTVHEMSLTVADFQEAEEIFSSGNISKVVPVIGFEGRDIGAGPIAKRARQLYWDWAHADGK